MIFSAIYPLNLPLSLSLDNLWLKMDGKFCPHHINYLSTRRHDEEFKRGLLPIKSANLYPTDRMYLDIVANIIK